METLLLYILPPVERQGKAALYSTIQTQGNLMFFFKQAKKHLTHLKTQQVTTFRSREKVTYIGAMKHRFFVPSHKIYSFQLHR